MRKTFISGLLCLGLVSGSSAEWGLSGATTLTRGVEARPTAVGGAYTGVPNDVQAIPLNPAVTATLKAPAVSATYLRGIADDNFGVINYGHPLPFGGVHVGGIYYNGGEFDASLLDGTEETRTAQEDMVGLLGISFSGKSPFSIGVTGKYYRLELAEEVSTSDIAYDAGVLWKTPLQGLTLGGSYLNAGPDVKFEVESDPLPSAGRVGASYLLDLSESRRFFLPYSFLITADGIFPKEDNSSFGAGIEFKRKLAIQERNGSASFRAGYVSDTQTVTAGLGFRVGNFVVDYSIGFKEDFDKSHRVSFGYEFAEPKYARGHQRGRTLGTY